MCGRAKQLFRAATRKRLISENPFGDMKDTNVKANEEREFFVTCEMAQKVIDACPDAEWRLIFALSRFGGLRCPSEHLLLKWGDVDWERDRFKVTSPKTEHHEGKGFRWVPIFPELRFHLEAAWDAAEPGTEWVIARYRDRNSNLRTQLHRIIRKSGLEPWPKVFQNLRSTRETELAESFPIHVVCEWIGNSEAVARKHYLQVTDAHFAKASGADLENGAENLENAPEPEARKKGPGRKSGPRGEGHPKAAQNPAQQMRGTACNPSQGKNGIKSQPKSLPSIAKDRRYLPRSQATRLGLEPRMGEPKSPVLPLHHRVGCRRLFLSCGHQIAYASGRERQGGMTTRQSRT